MPEIKVEYEYDSDNGILIFSAQDPTHEAGREDPRWIMALLQAVKLAADQELDEMAKSAPQGTLGIQHLETQRVVVSTPNPEKPHQD